MASVATKSPRRNRKSPKSAKDAESGTQPVAPKVAPEVQAVTEASGHRIAGFEEPKAEPDYREQERRVLAREVPMTYGREVDASLRGVIMHAVAADGDGSLARGTLRTLARELSVLAYAIGDEDCSVNPQLVQEMILTLSYRASAAAELDARLDDAEVAK